MIFLQPKETKVTKNQSSLEKKTCFHSLLRIWARICKLLWSPGIDSEESIQPAYVAWRACTTNRVLCRPVRLGIDSWASLKVYKYGLWYITKLNSGSSVLLLCVVYALQKSGIFPWISFSAYILILSSAGTPLVSVACFSNTLLPPTPNWYRFEHSQGLLRSLWMYPYNPNQRKILSCFDAHTQILWRKSF